MKKRFLPCHVDGVLVVWDHLMHEDNQWVAVLLNSHLVVHLINHVKRSNFFWIQIVGEQTDGGEV